MRHRRKQVPQSHEVGALARPDRRRDAANAHRFFVLIEGELEHDGHVRGANGIRWKVA